MRDAAGGLTGIPESDGSAHTAGNSHKMEAAVERYLEYEKKIQPLLKANADKMAKLESMVDSIPDGLQREVLRLRYMDAKVRTPAGRKNGTPLPSRFTAATTENTSKLSTASTKKPF